MRVLSVDCKEKGVLVTHDVSKMILTIPELKRFYDKAKQFPVLFGRELKDEQDFIDQFIVYDANNEPISTGLFFKDEVEGELVGMHYLTNICYREADAHFAFFDRRFRGRSELVKAVMGYVFHTWRLHRLNVNIPCYAGTAVHKFVSDLGFKLEGRKRQASFYKGQRFDVLLYGILRSELNGR